MARQSGFSRSVWKRRQGGRGWLGLWDFCGLFYRWSRDLVGVMRALDISCLLSKPNLHLTSSKRLIKAASLPQPFSADMKKNKVTTNLGDYFFGVEPTTFSRTRTHITTGLL